MSKMSELDIYVKSLSDKYNLKYEDVAKLLQTGDKLKLLYMWIKQGHLELAGFRRAMDMLDDVLKPF